MQVKFDSLNRDIPPILYVSNPNGQRLSIIPTDAYADLKIHLKFNEVSDLSLRVYKHIGQTEAGDIVDAVCYPLFQVRRYVEAEDLGHFRITGVTESDDDNDPYVDIEATSCEIEWDDKTVYVQSGTYKCYDTTDTDKTLFGQILAKFPDWTLGTIDETVQARYRTFDYTEESAYAFCMNTLEKTYECIFDFDYLHRTVSVYDSNSLVSTTDLFLSYDNFIQNITKKSLSDEVVTALQVQGSTEDITIRGVNPIGSDVIYNFDPFKSLEWMDQSLIDALNAWQTKISDKSTQMSAHYLDYNTKNAELITLKGNLVDLQSQLNAYNQSKSIHIANGDSLSDINAKIEQTQTAIVAKQTVITSKQAEIDAVVQSIQALQNELAIANNFTAQQLRVLNRYLIQAVYKEDNLVFTDSMDFAARQKVIEDLYAKGQRLLKRLSERRTEISIDCENFVLDKQFENFRTNLQLGKLLRVELQRGTDVANMMLLGFELNYSDRSLSLEFGNRYRLMDAYSKYQDLYGKANSTANTVSWNKELWSYGVKDGKIDKMSEFMNSSLDLTKNAIMSSGTENIVIDTTGLTGTTKDESGATDPEQIKVVHNAIAFTTDAWKTAATAIGKIYFPDGTVGFGVNAQYLIGDIILGHSMKISNASGTFSIDETGLHSEQLTRIETELEASKALTVNLSRDNMVVFAKDDTVDLSDATVLVTCILNSVDKTAEAQYQFAPVGLTGTWDKISHTYTVTSMSTTTGYVTITVTLNTQSVQKRFTVVQVNDGKTGTSVTAMTVHYAVSTSGDAPPTDGWSDTMPDRTDIEYLWGYYTVTFSDGTSHDMAPYVVAGAGEIYSEVINQIQTVEHEFQSKIDQTKSEIMQTVSETYATSESVNKQQTTIDQVSDRIEFVFENANGNIQKVSDALADDQALLKQYIRFSGALMELGRSDNAFTAQLSNEKLAFLENGTEIAYISNQKLYILDAQVKGRLSVGTGDAIYDIIVRPNKHWSLIRYHAPTATDSSDSGGDVIATNALIATDDGAQNITLASETITGTDDGDGNITLA